mmetsp:Transcript_30102/g.45991  ORF Transcript_30102/g.45991 Transcript_30102/m.45991 type:complete len:284 (-) Transcript_30102:3298-4149(-)
MTLTLDASDPTLLAIPSSGHLSLSFELEGVLGSYSSIKDKIDITIHYMCPCLTLQVNAMTISLDGSLRAERPVVFSKEQHSSASVLSWARFEQTVDEVNPATGVSTPITSLDYCGDLLYSLENLDGSPMTDTSVALLTTQPSSSGDGQVQLPSPAIGGASYSFQIKASVAVSPSVYTASSSLEVQYSTTQGCLTEAVSTPPAQSAKYFIGSGQIDYSLSGSFTPSPDCSYASTLTAAFENGTALNSSLIGFDSAALKFTVHCSEAKYLGTAEVAVTYEINNIF